MRFRKPRIGITLSEASESTGKRWPLQKGFDYLKREYHQAVVRSGGVPILLANVVGRPLIKSLLESIDGLLITGGADLHPKHFNQRPHKKLSRTTDNRDRFELEIIKQAMTVDLPILGICRGHQVLNIAMGGTLYQDLSCVPRKTLRHADPAETGKVFHKVMIERNSILYEIIGRTVIDTNSSHHQAVDKLGTGLRAIAFAPDGIVEALEHPGRDFLLSVQWHPEGIYRRAHARRVFDAFVKAATRLM